jgi:beta-galactosidase
MPARSLFPRAAQRTAVFLLLAGSALFAQADFFPMGVWYGGGKARAPMLERDPLSKREIWRKDLAQIRALGFNTVRAWIDWASAEPREGQYRFDTLDVIQELAGQEGLRVFVQVYMDSAPEWAGRKHPDSLFVSANGMAIRPESSPGYCRDHPAIRQADNAFYRALSAHLAKSKAFLGFDLWSEPHVINWANPTYIPNPEFCFCPHTQRRFRAWLGKKYATLDALNEAWYRRYESWDEIEPNRLSTILGYTDYIDWKAFIVDKLGEDLRERRDAVKAAAPRVIAASHAAGVGLFASPHHWEGQSDDWTMAAQVDYYGTSFYPKHSAFVDRDPPWRAALLDFTRSFGFAAGRTGFHIGELQAGFGTIALNVSPTVTPEDLRIWTWSALARGAKGIFSYAFYPMSTGYESGGFGLVELDGQITPRAREIGRIAALVDRHQALFLKAAPPKAQAAIVYNPLSHFAGGRQRATAYGGPQGEVAGIERDSLLGAYKALFPMNLPVDFVHAAHVTPEELAQYRLVILPYPIMLPSRSVEVFTRYVAAGGALVAEARAGWSNERGRSSDVIPGMGLAEVFCARETAVETAPQGRTEIVWGSPMLPGLEPGARLPARWYKENLEPLGERGRVVARFPDGSPAAVAATHGQGKTLLLGSYVAAAYHTAPSPEVRRFFEGLAAWAGVRNPLRVEGEVEARWLESGPERLLFLFNHGSRPQTVTWSLEGTASPVCLETGEPAAARLTLQPLQVRVIRLRAVTSAARLHLFK